MTREIKFRAYNPTTKEMMTTEFLGKNWVVDDLLPPNEWEVMQFTGLKDKNGKEVFEGDIVERKNEPCGDCGQNKSQKGEVYFHEMGFWAIMAGEHLSYNVSKVEKGSVKDQYNYLEIIGNIYENPDLLSTQSVDKK